MLKTIHFDIYYPYGIEDLAKTTARIAEGYVYIANCLNHELTEVVPIIVYPSHIDFQENNILPVITGEGSAAISTPGLRGSHGVRDVNQLFRVITIHDQIDLALPGEVAQILTLSPPVQKTAVSSFLPTSILGSATNG